MKKRSLTLFFVLFSLAHAIAQVTTSGISGVVNDSKETLVGATIQAVHVASGSTYGAITNHNGRYTILGMRAGGPYTITISFVGYKSNRFENVNLPLGETVTINTQLSEESHSLEGAIVTAKGGFNSRQTGSSSNFSKSQLESMPTISRSINDLTRLVPQANSTNNGMSFAGSNNRYNSFQIDGTVNNDVFGLSGSGTNGGQTGANPISIDAIEEVQVVIAPFDVRQSGFTGGGVNAITKSGTNQYKGSAYYYGNNQNFAGTTPGSNIQNREKLSKQSDAQYGFTFGGPIVKDKLFFFVNAEQQKKSYPLSYNVVSNAKPADNESDINKTDAELVRNKILELTNGKYDGGGYGPRDVFTNNTKALARIDWNINRKNKLTFRYSYLSGENLSLSRSKTTLRFNDNGFIYNNETNSLVAELNSQFSNSLNNEFRAGYTRVRDNRTLEADTPFPFVKIEHNGNTIQMGTEDNSAANRLDQDIYTITDNLNWNLGNHQVTFGTHNEFFLMENLYIRNLYGSYTYGSLDDFLSIGTSNEALPKNYYYSQANVDITGRKDWAPRFGSGQLGFYVQDQWDVTNNFRLTYGVRMDIPLFFDKPTVNAGFNASDIAQKHNLSNNNMPKATPLLSPRIGFRWNLNEDRTTVLRGGTGIFTGRIPFVWISNSFSNTGVEFQRYQYQVSSNGTNNYPDGFKFNADVNNQFTGNAQTSTEVNVVAKNFKFPQVFRSNLILEHSFKNGIKASVEGLYTKNINDINLNNIMYYESGETLKNGGDNRPIMKKETNNAYTNVLVLENTSKGYTWNVTGKVEKSFGFGLDLMAAYTIGESKSVNSGTSSVAYSNWQYNEQYAGPNNAELSYSDFDNRHRILGVASYNVRYAKHFKTAISLIYTGNTGSNYSVIYNGDINGDGVRGNDLMYIPTIEESKQMIFAPIVDKGVVVKTPEQQLAELNAYIDGHKDLKKLRGKYAERNALHAPFEHHFDLRIAQDFDFKVGRRTNTIQLSLDVLNIGNLFKRDWGLYYNPGYNHNPLSVAKVNNGTPTFQFKVDPDKQWIGISDYNSRWRMQLGVRYIF